MNEVAVDADVHHLIYAAIQKKQLILFGYKDKERVVEPHDYGIQNGIARLLSWQVGGQSSGRIPGWRWFDVAGMQNVEVLNKVFPGNRDVSGNHHRWDRIFIRVQPPEKSSLL